MNDFPPVDYGYGRDERALEHKFILILTLQMLLLLLSQPTAAQQEPDNRLEVLLRSASGAPIVGVTVTLAPREAALGGPAYAPAARIGVTNSAGWAAFERVPQGIWLLSFAGSAESIPLLNSALQGRPPYGTTTTGGGFFLAINGADGDDIKLEDGPSSGVQQAIFTGAAQGGVWVPQYDLSDPAMTPGPLSLVQTGMAPSATLVPGKMGAGGGSVATADSAAAGNIELTPLWLCYAPGILLGLILLGRAVVLRRVAEGRS